MADSIAEISAAVQTTVEHLRTLYIAAGLAAWNAAANSTPENLKIAADARAAAMRAEADSAEYARYRDWDTANAADSDPLLARQVKLLHYTFAQGQNDPETIERISELIRQIEETYYTFRATVDGKKLNNNQIDEVLDKSIDSEERRAVWEGHKAIGPLVAPSIRELARLRNRTAQKMGYPNFHRMSLTLGEIDPDWLYGMLDQLAARTDEPYRQAKAELDKVLSARFHVPIEELRPWHYSDLYFQRAPKLGDTDFDAFFSDQKLEELAIRTYDGLGMDVRDILARSDLYERENKDQHAFCIHIDREGDVRTLNNLRPVERWMDTILHELGHGVYDKYIPKSVPWLLRTPAHILYTEAMAELMGGMALDREWLIGVRGLSQSQADAIADAAWQRQMLERLIFPRWVMVMVNFERAMYENPEADLDTIWWTLVEKYQYLIRPEGRKMPDWATKNHVALAPAYYQNYLIGYMVAEQWRHWLDLHIGGIIDRPAAGQFFRDEVFAPGATLPWADALAFATGEKLNIDYYVTRYVIPA
ncbi:MAG: M2 family metallopeptidase [Aggregatilineales bacterium]